MNLCPRCNASFRTPQGLGLHFHWGCPQGATKTDVQKRRKDRKPPGEAPWPTLKAEAEAALKDMQKASAAFYTAAVRVGCHTFIEFTGLMNEYIKACSQMSSAGDDSWLLASTHTNKPLKLHQHQVRYLAEKLDCIFGPTLRHDKQLLKAFLGETPKMKKRKKAK